MDRDQVAKCAQQCNMKKREWLAVPFVVHLTGAESAKLAEDQSVHLYLCILIDDLTKRYGPVIRQGRVTGVLDDAFDVVVVSGHAKRCLAHVRQPEFGIEKRVHVDKMPVDNAVFDEHKDILSLYWTTQDVLSLLAESSEDPHLLKIKASGDRNGTVSNSTNGVGSAVPSKQSQRSAQQSKPQFEGLRSTPSGHRIQDVRELMPIPVIVTSDMTKSPPVLVVYACELPLRAFWGGD